MSEKPLGSLRIFYRPSRKITGIILENHVTGASLIAVCALIRFIRVNTFLTVICSPNPLILFLVLFIFSYNTDTVLE